MTYTAVVPSNKPTFSLRLPEDLRSDLQELATAEDRSLNYLIIRTLREYVTEKKKAAESPKEFLYPHGAKPGPTVSEP